MKKFITSTMAILMVCLTFMANDLLANEGTVSQDIRIENQVQLQEQPVQFVQSGVFPFLGEISGFPMEFSKTHIILLSIILAITLLVFAHKNSFETDIYAFYHSNGDGNISFETTEEQNDYEFRSFLAKVFRVLGILVAFSSLVLIIT
ncbi:hypothetical protein MMU07_14425 [Aquiflexum sp. LQ15W]|uniref:hypothetical protein n=1 Tax=Cognataquiflexum nitidum TaxID=2922272 RepID=UPI001F13FA9D|nr:hypothetical protein [Cognataquiflexum nitidum]MCH6200777.1 hypothetical protein [Cognataquiflexum nitidum]